MKQRPTVTRESKLASTTVVRRGESQPRVRAARRWPALTLGLALVAFAMSFVLGFGPQVERMLRDNVLPLVTGVQTRPKAAPANAQPPASPSLPKLIAKAPMARLRVLIMKRTKQDIDEPQAGMTLLMHAARHGRVDVARLLLELGANPDARGHAQRTALQYASEKNQLDVARVLLDAGANVDGADNTRLTPLIMAADRGYTELALMFIQRDANVNLQHIEGWTALMDAAESGNSMLVRALLEAGAVVGARHRSGQTALDMAISGGHKEVIRLLRTRDHDSRRTPGADSGNPPRSTNTGKKRQRI